MKLKLNKVFEKHMKYWYVFNKNITYFAKKESSIINFHKYDDASILSIFISNDNSKITRLYT